MRDYMEEAQAEFEKKQRWEIERIAQRLKEEAETEERERNCTHPNYYSTNHGYHNYCTECGKDLF